MIVNTSILCSIRGYDRRFRTVVLDDFVFFLDLLRFLKLELGSERLHLLIEVFADLRDVASQNLFDLGNILLVFFQ